MAVAFLVLCLVAGSAAYEVDGKPLGPTCWVMALMMMVLAVVMRPFA